MIRINLAPREELESQIWYLPELIILVLVGVTLHLVVESELNGIRSQIASSVATRDEFNEKAKQIQPKLERFKTLGKDKENLMVKLRALQQITDSKLGKYKPLIAIEHLQNLKPEGVWLKSLIVEDGRIEFDAMAMDNILVSEFITALKSTQLQDIDPSDLRTQIFFNEVTLSGTSVVQGTPAAADAAVTAEESTTVRFKLTVVVGERTPPAPQPGNKQAFNSRNRRQPWTRAS